jgi:rSAM-associated Gly-rich repeat protein
VKNAGEVVEARFGHWYSASTHILSADERTTIMTHSHRRQFLKDLLGTLAQGAGTIVLASAATARALARDTGDQNTDIQKRAEDLAEAAGASEEEVRCNFVNRAFRNAGGGGGGFRNGGFANGGGGGGAFRNGGFANGRGGGGAFRNGAFRN